ncbi:MAG: acyl-CoA dehydrogenase family protein, partial [Deltaproteobacteria bacterium]|nr:acyl-CoA dehydrogenase family protein [Deltaproteobacteria bacterium]
MDVYPWWTEEHKAFDREIRAFAQEVMPLDAQTRWKRKFPREIFDRIAEKGYNGAGVPREYGGLGLGATGACIA